MKIFFLLIGLFFGFAHVANAQTVVDVKHLPMNEFAESLGSYRVQLEQKERIALLDAAKAINSEAFKHSKKTFSMNVDKVPIGDVLSLLNPDHNVAICKDFAKNADPLIRFMTNYQLGKSGEKFAASNLSKLFREHLTLHQAQIIRTMALLHGIVPEKHSSNEIFNHLKELGSKKEKLQAGDTVKQFEVEDLNGKSVTLASLKGKPVIFHFWATWCGPCMAQMEKNIKSMKELPHEVTIVFVNLDLDRDTCLKAIKEIDLKCTHVYSEGGVSGALPYTLGIKGLPSDVLIDANGEYFSNDISKVRSLLVTSRKSMAVKQSAD